MNDHPRYEYGRFGGMSEAVKVALCDRERARVATSDPQRGTGRTARMVDAAGEAARGGLRVLIIAGDESALRFVRTRMRDALGVALSSKITTADVEGLNDVRGYRFDRIFEDHTAREVIERRWEREKARYLVPGGVVVAAGSES